MKDKIINIILVIMLMILIFLIVYKVMNVKINHVDKYTIYMSHHIICKDNNNIYEVNTDGDYKITSVKFNNQIYNNKEMYFEEFKNEIINDNYICKEDL